MLVLLDRDGVINEDRSDFVKSPDELIFIEGALKAIARLNAAGHKVVVVTNQSCIGRGIITVEQLSNIHQKLHHQLKAVSGHLDDIFIAPDAPWEATEMRKPGPGMLQAAMEKYRTTATDTVLVGDAERDLRAAKSAGCHRILVQTGKGRATQAAGIEKDLLPLRIAENLEVAVDYIQEGRF
ncbi:MAG: HAD-IIIA family hydrolase [Proteobacteria bacterium]|nr:HAD-IIIA family hydrolase [Pseudomonadota bacterium]